MANAREILGRMKSIKDTMKITNAMYMVSSSKLQKARRDLKNTEPYFHMIQDGLAKILNVAPEAGNDYFDERPERSGNDRRKGFLVITADKGLAGAYNHNIIRSTEESAAMQAQNMLFIVGQVGRHYFERKNIPIDISFNYTAQNPTMNRARHIAKILVELFEEEKLDEVYVIYTKMVNSMTVEPVTKKLLPLKEEHIEIRDENNYYENAEFMPDAQSVFNNIVPDYVAGFIYGALIESYCSEHNARMMAMETATDAASEMLKQLGVQYNRARQAAITQEITEIIAGAKAQKKKN
ncbi:MAG TPA: ATP synthase F1 subunit gamma [Candidatus Eubacterium faecipullorum]|uniref:ATP synthase gamma chain n=1 Tax=Candidatus Eubacterium faecipullorum TaxID=2838571 RepID=A0A9D1RDZ6_9FIRM|nr:ATP synthase F1 subunit gamma [Candidatus Eubacterium faecipullorum]